MKGMICKGLLATGLLVLGQAAAARPLHWNCDTGAGNFSQLDAQADGPAYRITGQVTAVQLRDDPRWAPSATIMIEDSAGNAAAIRIGRVRSNRLEVRLATIVGGSRAERAFATALSGTMLPFDLSVSASGELFAQVGTERAEGTARIGPGAKVMVICSTGEFDFEQIELDAPARR